MEQNGAGSDVDDDPAYVRQAWSVEGQLPLLLFIAALLGLGKGGVPGFATVATAATVATSPTNISGGLGLAVALQVPILTMIDVSAAWLNYQDLDFETIQLLLPTSFCGMALGTWLDQYLSDSSARLLAGILLLLILAVQMGGDSITALFPTNQQKAPNHASNHDNNKSDTFNDKDDLSSARYEDDDDIEGGTGTGTPPTTTTQAKIPSATATDPNGSIFGTAFVLDGPATRRLKN